MNFEEYININREKLQPKINQKAMWNGISENLPPSKPKHNYKFLIKYLIGVLVIILVSLYLFNNHQETELYKVVKDQELMALRAEINDLMKKEKTSSRIRAVSMSEDMGAMGQDIVTTLVDRMVNDTSPNVQLAAVRALEKHIKDENVRIAMIETLANTQDSYLQIKLINMLSQHKEKRLLPFLDSIISMGNKRSIVLDCAARNKRILKEI